MGMRIRRRPLVILIGVILAAFSLPARAQDNSSPSEQATETSNTAKPSSADAVAPTADDESSGVQIGVRLASSPLEVRESDLVGYAGYLATRVSPLRWGAFYVRSADVFQVFDSIQLSPVGGIVPPGNGKETRRTTSFRTDIVYDHLLPRSRLTVQYSPRLLVTNGRLFGNYANQSVHLDLRFRLSPRWDMRIGNRLIHNSTRNVGSDFSLDVDSVSAYTVQSQFIDGPGSLLDQSTSLDFSYRMTARNRVGFGGGFSYSYLRGEGIADVPFSARNSAGSVGWQRQMSARRDLGIGYSYRLIQASKDNYSGVGYHNIEWTFVERFAPNWVLGASFGAGNTGLLSTGQQQWYASGSLSLARRFHRSIVRLAYTRGQPLFANLALQGGAERIDVSYQVEPSQKWLLRADLGYQRSLSSSIAATTVQGKYATTQFGYHISREFTWFASYGHKWQSADLPNILPGRRNFLSFGVRWRARPLHE